MPMVVHGSTRDRLHAGPPTPPTHPLTSLGVGWFGGGLGRDGCGVWARERDPWGACLVAFVSCVHEHVEFGVRACFGLFFLEAMFVRLSVRFACYGGLGFWVVGGGAGGGGLGGLWVWWGGVGCGAKGLLAKVGSGFGAVVGVAGGPVGRTLGPFSCRFCQASRGLLFGLLVLLCVASVLQSGCASWVYFWVYGSGLLARRVEKPCKQQK